MHLIIPLYSCLKWTLGAFAWVQLKSIVVVRNDNTQMTNLRPSVRRSVCRSVSPLVGQSVRPSYRPSVGMSVGWSVGLSLFSLEKYSQMSERSKVSMEALWRSRDTDTVESVSDHTTNQPTKLVVSTYLLTGVGSRDAYANGIMFGNNFSTHSVNLIE